MAIASASIRAFFEDTWWPYLLQEAEIAHGKRVEAVVQDESLLIAKELARQGITLQTPVKKAIVQLLRVQARGDTVELATVLNHLPGLWAAYRLQLQQAALDYFESNANSVSDFTQKYFDNMTFELLWNDVWERHVGDVPLDLRMLADIQKWLLDAGAPSDAQVQQYKKARVVRDPETAFALKPEQVRTIAQDWRAEMVTRRTQQQRQVEQRLQDAMDRARSEQTAAANRHALYQLQIDEAQKESFELDNSKRRVVGEYKEEVLAHCKSKALTILHSETAHRAGTTLQTFLAMLIPVAKKNTDEATRSLEAALTDPNGYQRRFTDEEQARWISTRARALRRLESDAILTQAEADAIQRQYEVLHERNQEEEAKLSEMITQRDRYDCLESMLSYIAAAAKTNPNLNVQQLLTSLPREVDAKATVGLRAANQRRQQLWRQAFTQSANEKVFQDAKNEAHDKRLHAAVAVARAEQAAHQQTMRAQAATAKAARDAILEQARGELQQQSYGDRMNEPTLQQVLPLDYWKDFHAKWHDAQVAYSDLDDLLTHARTSGRSDAAWEPTLPTGLEHAPPSLSFVWFVRVELSLHDCAHWLQLRSTPLPTDPPAGQRGHAKPTGPLTN